MQLTGIKQITGHKSDMVAQKYIDHSKQMKQGGGVDTLFLKGLQKDEEGQVLRKRKQHPYESSQPTKPTAGPTAGGNMASVNFYNCASVNYNSKTNEFECL